MQMLKLLHELSKLSRRDELAYTKGGGIKRFINYKSKAWCSILATSNLLII